ncbi:hypothetical protein BDV26DRAFT_294791 [Aspergillus bertholletiae]|uniref:Uncharacterized protein n=1 Tax=Aspergillus bertholletiae TaxID=1226010 RepID=A0A5N7B269_9EURO|nr:hypothetical protein BDV26DRAFT_294791 [Aspergillus bertholletiae]
MRVISLFTVASTLAVLAAASQPAAIVRRQPGPLDTPLSVFDIADQFDSLSDSQIEKALKKLPKDELRGLQGCLEAEEEDEGDQCRNDILRVAMFANYHGLLYFV